jgi:uncharacterized protein
MTPEVAVERQIERYRMMTGPQRLKIALDLHEFACNVAREGSLYSCERLVYPEYKLGNLRDPACDLGETAYSLQQRIFGFSKRDSLPEYCRRCSYRFACSA